MLDEMLLQGSRRRRKIMRRTEIKRRTLLSRGNGLKRGGRIGAGKKTKAWESERAKLKRRFLAVGIITCELRYTGCAFDNLLGFAHADKRRKLSREDLSVVILACNFCHDKIEIDPRMKEIVMNVIAARKVQP